MIEASATRKSARPCTRSQEQKWICRVELSGVRDSDAPESVYLEGGVGPHDQEGPVMNDQLQLATGGCYCGQVRYRARGVGRQVTECHCSQCRKQAGHRYAATSVKFSDIEIDGAANITWYQASPDAARGFCATCGSHLFWKSPTRDDIGILAASFDQPSGLRMTKHIFVDNKGDYYDITDDLPQFAGYDRPVSSE
jgi:hypothetical protein